MKVIKTKELLSVCTFCGVLALSASFLGHWMPFDYFSNPAIEKHYLYLVNDDIRSFIFAVPTFLVILGIFLYYFKEKPMIAMHLLTFLFFVSREIMEGSILILNTTNLLEPEISSFRWSTWYEYKQYLHTFFIPYILISSVVMFGLIPYFMKTMKASGGVKFES